MKKDNIVLIGMPGVGKSTAGVILAKVLGYEFVDADLVIQKEEGKLLKEIIEEVGTDGFIAVENRVNSSLEVDHSIIATGGSVVYGKEAMEHLKSIGTVVYLQLPFEELNRRLSDIKGRGVVLKDGQTLKDLYDPFASWDFFVPENGSPVPIPPPVKAPWQHVHFQQNK